MRVITRLFAFGFILLVLAIVLGLGYFGLIPGVSSILGSNKPRDLGIAYTQADLSSGRIKSQIVYEILSQETSPALSWQTGGSRPVNTEFSSAEITAIMNNKPGKYFPYKNVQLKFNADGSGEISGQLIKDRLPLYGATFEAPRVAVDFVMKFLPPDPVFYLRGKASLEGNKVLIFEPQRFEIGRVPMPLQMILAFSPVKQALAIDISGMTNELVKIKDKRELIIDFINSRLAKINGFYAEDAHFSENKLIFKGTLPEKEATVR